MNYEKENVYDIIMCVTGYQFKSKTPKDIVLNQTAKVADGKPPPGNIRYQTSQTVLSNVANSVI